MKRLGVWHLPRPIGVGASVAGLKRPVGRCDGCCRVSGVSYAHDVGFTFSPRVIQVDRRICSPRRSGRSPPCRFGDNLLRTERSVSTVRILRSLPPCASHPRVRCGGGNTLRVAPAHSARACHVSKPIVSPAVRRFCRASLTEATAMFHKSGPWLLRFPRNIRVDPWG